ncbi:MAG: hypothetical protein QXW98_04190 [Candidatus Caldarchaeum sp.]
MVALLFNADDLGVEAMFCPNKEFLMSDQIREAIRMELPKWKERKAVGYYRIVSLVSSRTELGIRECFYGESPLGVAVPPPSLEKDILEKKGDPDLFLACYDETIPVIIRGEAYIEAALNIEKGQYVTASTLGTAIPCAYPYVRAKMWPCVGIALDSAKSFDLVKVLVLPMLVILED